MSKHILVISQYFYPEEFRINDITKEWIKRGYKVTVVTGIPNYPIGKFYEGYSFFKKRKEVFNGVNVIRLPIVPRGSSSIMLAINYISFVLSGYFWSKFTKINSDLVFIYEVSPMSQALPGIWFAKKRGIPCITYITDLWPENVEYVIGLKNKKLINLIGRMSDYIYKNSTKILTSSNSFIEKIHKRGIPREKLEFWPQYAEDFYQPPLNNNYRQSTKENIFNITFAGNIGYAQGLNILPDVAEILKRDQVNFCFNIIGDGRYKSTLIREIKEKNLEKYFNFIGKKPATDIPKYLAASDAALISLAESEVFSITIPAKTQSCMACGIPIILSANGEVQKIIIEAEAGVVSNAGDVEKLAQNIKNMANLNDDVLKKMGSNSRDYYIKNFSKNLLLDKIDDWFLKYK